MVMLLAIPLVPLVGRITAVAFILYFPVIILDLLVVERLLRLEYNLRLARHDREPHDYVFVPPEKDFGVLAALRNTRARKIVFIRWLLSTPEWVRTNRNARLLIWLHRLLAFGVFLPLLSLVVLALLQG
jgi:hypothetical protein